jgi:cytochrome c-type biogenesis protein CcsB
VLLHHKILAITTILYLLLAFLYLLSIVGRLERLTRPIWAITYCTFAAHTLGLLMRWIESYRLGMGHVPLTNFYESLLFFAWASVFVLILTKRMFASNSVGFSVVLFSLVLMGYASLSPSVDQRIRPLIPALQSNWLHIHVFTCFMGYAFFFLAFVSSLLMFSTSNSGLLAQRRLEDVTYRSTLIGFLMLTAGILSGAVWAHYAWGAYWSWDPKETWSLITWIIYAILLHARITRRTRGRAMAALSIVGFASVLFTYLGVNFLLSGLHSYA